MNSKWKKYASRDSVDTSDDSVSHLIKEIKSRLTLIDNGTNVSYAMGFDTLVDALFSKVEHHYILDLEITFNVFLKAVNKSFIADQNFKNPDEILRNFDSGCKNKLKVKHKFFLITSISLINTFELPRRKTVNECVITFSKTEPNIFKRQRKELIDQMKFPKYFDHGLESQFTWVRVSVDAPDYKTAFMKAIRSLDLYRGVWHLQIAKNRNVLAFTNESEFPTDSVVAMGMVHTLHSDTLKSFPGMLWHETRQICGRAANIRQFDIAQNQLDKFFFKINKKNDPKYRDFLNGLITNYINALDETDHSIRFMKLWVVLEKLTDADDAKTILKRATFFYKDAKIQKAILESSKIARNISAPVGVNPYNVEMKNFQLCEYIEDILNFFIANRFHFKKLHEVFDFISVTTDENTIDQTIARLKLVKKYIGP
ncbi:MAG: hypothetical protein HY254_02045 [Burkholderiales bacterium]|nr:hypothetical protein [Burkholderiales bacterium]